MELSFNKGDYDQHMTMVNATKELLNDSIVLRSIKENVDFRISKSNEQKSSEKEINLILILAIPLALILLIAIFQHTISWRIFPLIGLVCFFIFYKALTKKGDDLKPLSYTQVHEDQPKPLKFLEMKVDYLLSLSSIKQSKLELLRIFYFIFFPFLCYFCYELVIGATPFNNILIGLVIAIGISTISWFLFFKDDFKALRYSRNQLEDYKRLIEQHYLSYTSEEE